MYYVAGYRPGSAEYLPSPQGVLVEEGRGRLGRYSPTLELPDVVLELDAEDSPYVRPFDATEDGRAQRAKWGYDPDVDEARHYVTELKRDVSADAKKIAHAARRGSYALNATHISNHEVLMVALLGGNNVSKALRHSESDTTSDQDVFARKCALKALTTYGVPSSILEQGPGKVIPFMLQRQAHSENALRGLLHKTLENVQQQQQEQQCTQQPLQDEQLFDTQINIQSYLFAAHVKKCQFAYELRKMCTLLHSPTLPSLDVDVEVLDEVTLQLITILDTSTNTARVNTASMTFINNLTLKRIVADKPLSSFMTLFGLHLASTLGILTSILQYAEMCLAMGAIGPSVEGIGPTCAEAASAILAALHRGEGSACGIRQSIFALVMGTVHGSTESQASLLGLEASGPNQRPEDYELRTQLYGELGAIRMLWHHWAARRDVEGTDTQHLEDVYVRAFLRCAQLLGSIGSSRDPLTSVNNAIDTTTCTGVAYDDSLLDLKTVDAIEASYIARNKNMPGRSALAKLEQRINRREVLEALNQPNIADALILSNRIIDRVAGLQIAVEEGGLDRGGL
ncbi:hypothetical protein BD289DRAFT_472768 [Coniella lustricola]|uniref:Uncharacterized protein n=1 Tax=Coniella lustricola TaxID=2025994 RepID=A0A2T3AE79_9PEZI|nr:hypothetical protein BD289DRAFT_472768 [Coniella lustricola]